MSVTRCNEFGHFVPRPPGNRPDLEMYCDCNDIRMVTVDPHGYAETKDYVQSMVEEGLYRGEHLSAIIEAVVEGIPLDNSEALIVSVKANEQRLIDYYRSQPDCEPCSRCRRIVSCKDLVCESCAAGKHPFADLMA